MLNIVKAIGALVVVASLSACSGGSDGPDEFLVLPTKPLDEPKSYTDLPTPNPQGRNLADQRPIADSVIALGGRESSLDSTRILAGEQALIAAASKYGVTANIRELLAAEAPKRSKRSGDRLLYRLAGVEDPQGTGSGDAIDPNATLNWLRARGVWTPTAPEQ